MSTIVVRFPDGYREFHMTSRALEVGDRGWRDGDAYRVRSGLANDHGGAVIVVEPESPTVGEALRSESGAIVLEPVGTERDDSWPEPFEFVTSSGRSDRDWPTRS